MRRSTIVRVFSLLMKPRRQGKTAEAELDREIETAMRLWRRREDGPEAMAAWVEFRTELLRKAGIT